MSASVPPEFLVVDFSSDEDCEDGLLETQQDGTRKTVECVLGKNEIEKMGGIFDENETVEMMFAKDRVIHPSEEKEVSKPRSVPVENTRCFGKIHHYVFGSALFKRVKSETPYGFVVELIEGLWITDKGFVSDDEIITPGTVIFDANGSEIGTILDVYGNVNSPMYICAQPTAKLIKESTDSGSPYSIKDFPMCNELSELLIKKDDYPPGTPVYALLSCLKINKEDIDEGVESDEI